MTTFPGFLCPFLSQVLFVPSGSDDSIDIHKYTYLHLISEPRLFQIFCDTPRKEMFRGWNVEMSSEE